jgi:hypothetical protein
MSEYFDEAGNLNVNGRSMLKQIAISLSKRNRSNPDEKTVLDIVNKDSDGFIAFSRLLVDAFKHDQGERALHTLDNERLLSQFIPDFEKMRNCTQNDFHHKPVLAHTFEALEHLDDFMENPEMLSEDYVSEIERLLESDIRTIAVGEDSDSADGEKEETVIVPSETAEQTEKLQVKAVLRFAMLFHDIAKPVTKTERPDGHITFYEHDLFGANTAGEFARSIQALAPSEQAVHSLIRHHQLLGFISRDESPNKKSVNRFISKLGKLTPVALIFCISDRMAARGPAVPQDNIDRHFDYAQTILDTYFNPPAPPAKPLLNGEDIKTILGIEEGPKIGRILAECERRRRLGWLKDRESALAWLKEMKR